MSRIADTLIERLKKEVQLTALCSRYNIELQPQGKNLISHCPFHEDRSPSFVVTPSNNLWNCLGACQGGGDNIRFMMKIENISFRHAVEKLQTIAGLTPEPATLQTRMGTEHSVLVPNIKPSSPQNDQSLLKSVVDFYHQSFLNGPQAMSYLQKRYCFHPEAAKQFKIGYANRTLGYRVPTTTADGKKLKSSLQKLGILRASGHEHLNGSVVIPLFDEHGNIVQMYGRKIIENLRKGTPDHLYLGSELRGVFNGFALEHQSEILLCESIIDALTLWSAGLRNVTCTFGTNNFTPDLCNFFKRIQPKRIIICFDNDEAGNAASLKYAPELAKIGAIVLRASIPFGQDINDIARTHSNNPAAALAACIEKAEFIAGESPTQEITYSLAAKKETPCEEPAVIIPEPISESISSTTSTSEPTSNTDEATFIFGERHWRVRGLAKNLSYETLRIQLRILRQSATNNGYHLDTLDLCNAKHRQSFIAQAVSETSLSSDILKKDIGHILLQLELQQEALIKTALQPKQQLAPSLTEEAREAALALLRDPQLLDRILVNYEQCGIVGEATNKLIGYLAAISRKLDEPLALIIQSTSAAGKSSLMEAILAFVPAEERIKYSAMTGQSLYYLGDTDLRHKVLAIVEEEGAEKASYSLKLLQSERELTIASTGKDQNSGRMVTQEYHVEGPVMIMLTTTAIDIDEELMNRCIVLTVDESRAQTKAIHELQREKRTLEGVRRKLDKTGILELHRNAQRLLRPLRIVNPYARKLTFLDDRTRTRRDHEKYLTLIDVIAFLHQYQRPIKSDSGNDERLNYIEVTLSDIITANRIAGEVLGRSLDELPPQTRRLLELITTHVTDECERLALTREAFRFTRRDVRQWIGWGDTQLKIHLHRLEEMEYLLTQRAPRGQNFVYELLYNGEGKNGSSFVMGLINPDLLTSEKQENNNYDGTQSGKKEEWSGPGRPEVGGVSVGGRTTQRDSEVLYNQAVEFADLQLSQKS
jgi:DNA primase catalytic core